MTSFFSDVYWAAHWAFSVALEGTVVLSFVALDARCEMHAV